MISISGHSTTSCPSSSIRPTSGWACARGRVTMTFTEPPPPRRGLRQRDQLVGERVRIGPAPPLDPAAVLGCDQRREHFAVVVGRHRSEAARADTGDDRALGLDPAARLGIVRKRNELLFTGADLERECALGGLGEHRVDRQPEADPIGESQAVEAAGGEDERVEPSLGRLAKSRVDVASERLDRDGRLQREQLGPTTDRRRPDAHPRLDRSPRRRARRAGRRARGRRPQRDRPCRSRSCPSPSVRRRRSARRAAPPRSP